ncbi:MAG: L,D-transpeptidase family protein [Pseudomonadota bacterium]
MRNALSFALVLFAIGIAGSAKASELDRVSLALAERIQENDGHWADAGDARQITLIADYEAAGYAPIWVSEAGITDKGRALMALLRKAPENGLMAEDYVTPALTAALDAIEPAALADLDARLSFALLNYADHVRAGRLEPSAVNRDLRIAPERPDLGRVLAGARMARDMEAFGLSLEPPGPRYARLKQALADFRAIAAEGGWTLVPSPVTGKSLKPGMTDPMVQALARRMIEVGTLDRSAFDFTAEDPVYEGPLVEAVKAFQGRLSLEMDGVVGPNTLKQINITAAERVRQIEINLERRRWMPDDLGSYYVFVNLADQYLKVVRRVEKDGVSREKTLHAARTVVGKTYHKTPVFTEQMTYLVLNPNWNVPYSIATREYLPKLWRDPGVLSRQNIRVLAGGQRIDPYSVHWASYSRSNFPFRLQQASGPRNALGRVKFMFPNKYNIYIHDTPSKSLFNRALRTFSHGCVRVEDPLKLAEVLLGPEGMERDQIDRIVQRGKRRVVKLDNPIPVHITYLTAWVNKDGSVHFRRDVYGRDAILAKAWDRIQVARN